MLDSQVQPNRTQEPRRSASGDGPVHPTPQAISTLRPLPLDGVRFDGTGLLGQWQERNRSATIPHCVAELEHSGAMDNVRGLRDPSDKGFTGMWFADTDIYKTLEAALWELGRQGHPTGPADFIETTAALLADVQEADGYLNSHVMLQRPERKWQDLRWSHEMYCAGHLIQAGVAAARVGASDTLVEVSRRIADLLVQRFGPAGVDAVDGHPEIETALVELYRTTGHRPYLELAKRFIDLRGRGLLGEDKFGRSYFQDQLPVRDAVEVAGHAVRQLYLLAGMVDVAVETGDEDLLRTARRLWNDAFTTKTYLTGAHGSRHRDEAFGDPYELPPDRAYAETCAAIASFQWNWRMLLADGERRYADEMERALYNAIAGSTALDGCHFFYSNPLQLRTGHDGSNEDAPASRLPWYSCACCPPNLARLMASLHTYAATTDERGLQIHLYSAGNISAMVDGGPVEVAVRTDYPWHGRVEFTVRADQPRAWTLALRIPGWCDEYRVEINGVAVDAVASDGYLRLTRDWSAVTVVLQLAMPPRMVSAHPYVDAVRGCVALVRGPLVYSLEQTDLAVDLPIEAVQLDPAQQPELTGPAEGLPDAPVLTVQGSVRAGEPGALYRDATTAAEASPTPVTLTAVPYFLWGNRTPGPMRVWIPTDTSAGA